MAHIDVRAVALSAEVVDSLRVRALLRSPPDSLLVTEEQRIALHEYGATPLADIGGVVAYYLGGVPLILDERERPPALHPDPAIAPGDPDLDALKARRLFILHDVIRAEVSRGIPLQEREALAALLLKATLLRMTGSTNPNLEGVMLALLVALGWCEGAMELSHTVAQAIAAATTREEVEAVTLDLEPLGPPPLIAAGDIAVLLRGG